MAKSFIRKAGSGGFLHGVSGQITDYLFETKKGEGAKGPWTSLSVKLTIKPDGAEPVDQYLNAGFLYGDNTVSKDGKTIEGQDSYTLRDDTQWGKFLVAVIEKGGESVEAALGEGRDYSALIGIRLTFARIVDEDGTIEAGKRKLGAVKAKTATREQLIEAGKREDKKDKSKRYMLDNLLVSEVLALPEVKKGGASKPAANKPAAAAPAAKAASTDTTTADAALTTILQGVAGQTLERAKINSAVVKYALNAKLSQADRDALRKTLMSDEYLDGAAERGLIVADGTGKSATITLVPADEQEAA